MTIVNKITNTAIEYDKKSDTIKTAKFNFKNPGQDWYIDEDNNLITSRVGSRALIIDENQNIVLSAIEEANVSQMWQLNKTTNTRVNTDE